MSKDGIYSKASDEWVARTVAHAVILVNQDWKRRKVDIPMDDALPFLQKATRGFIVEFVRQLRDEVPNLNNPELIGQFSHKLESKPGLYHAAACKKWLRTKLAGDDDSQCNKMLGDIIFRSVDSFIDRQSELTGRERQPIVSIRHDVEAIDRMLAKASVMNVPAIDVRTGEVSR